MHTQTFVIIWQLADKSIACMWVRWLLGHCHGRGSNQCWTMVAIPLPISSECMCVGVHMQIVMIVTIITFIDYSWKVLSIHWISSPLINCSSFSTSWCCCCCSCCCCRMAATALPISSTEMTKYMIILKQVVMGDIENFIYINCHLKCHGYCKYHYIK